VTPLATGLARGYWQSRRFRYAIVLLAGWSIILVLAAAYYLFSPKAYSSGFTLILPGAGQSSSVNLETLGQVSSQSASVFGDMSFSPTENYKKLLQSYRMRGLVGARFNLDVGDVSPPRIRLANQTKLIYVTITAQSAVLAEQLAQAWLDVFQREVQSLRVEEQAIRETSYRSTLAMFEEAVELSRARIIAFQIEHSLISIHQFQDLVQRSEALKALVDDSLIAVEVAENEIARLSSLLDLSPDQAAQVMVLISDPVFQSLFASASEAENTAAALTLTFGPNHPEHRAASFALAGLEQQIRKRGRFLLGVEAFDALNTGHYAASQERATLISSLLEASVAGSGARQRHIALQAQLDATLQRVDSLAEPATQLDGLLRDHQIAETVFASALARLDTNRTDQFASYPLTQIIEYPAQPRSPVSPSKKFVAAGTLAVLISYILGLTLLWIRLPIIRALLKTS